MSILIPKANLSINADGVPKGSRTPVAWMKTRCPRPLDEGDTAMEGANSRGLSAIRQAQTTLCLKMFVFRRVQLVTDPLRYLFSWLVKYDRAN